MHFFGGPLLTSEFLMKITTIFLLNFLGGGGGKKKEKIFFFPLTILLEIGIKRNC